MTTPHLCEVWGDPIAHSLSPALHTAAYRRLGWAWQYGRRRVDEAAFATELAGLGADYRGLSLTMPLKHAAFTTAVRTDADAAATGAVNTLVPATGGFAGFNTDVGGLVQALTESGFAGVDRARIVGAGATATSALVALARVGATDVEIVARRPEAAAALTPLADSLGIGMRVAPLDAPGQAVPLTVSTLPGDTPVPAAAAARLAELGGHLFDVVYGHWPTTLGSAWTDAGATAEPGTAMLLHQAVRQIRIFATGDVTAPLPDEGAVVDVMRRALVGG